MPANSPTLRRAAARAGAAARHHHPNADADRADLAVERIAAYVERVVASAPPLTADQRDPLALLLRGAGGPDAAA